MKLTAYKTKIVCTIGPTSRSLPMIEKLIKAGMNVARLNFSHGDREEQRENIRNVRKASENVKCPVSILVDLPGVKMRVGNLKAAPLILKKGEDVTLTSRDIIGTGSVIPVSYKKLPQSVARGGIIYMCDGFIQLRVEDVSGTDIHCKVIIGGNLYSHKGINLPGAKLFVNPVTREDLDLIDFALSEGVTTFGLSFVEKAGDINKIREFARKRGKAVYLVAKIERKEAVKNFSEILKAADGIMIARGDLGIEVPIEDVPFIQKRLIREANLAGIPVITATQMLGSMTQNVRPTRAEVTDVANAILDGTDAVMLSEETAMGDYPVETVQMMAKIAEANEHMYHNGSLSEEIREQVRSRATTMGLTISDVISLNAVGAARKLQAEYIISQTSSGNTSRQIARFKPNCWILSFNDRKEVCEFLNFSYGVQPFLMKKNDIKQPMVALKIIKSLHLAKKGDTVIITERRLSDRPGETDSLGIVTI